MGHIDGLAVRHVGGPRFWLVAVRVRDVAEIGLIEDLDIGVREGDSEAAPADGGDPPGVFCGVDGVDEIVWIRDGLEGFGADDE